MSYPASLYSRMDSSGGDNLAEPLLLSDEETGEGDGKKEMEDAVSRFDYVKNRFLVYGCVAGFTIQVLSLSAYVYSLIRWGTPERFPNADPLDNYNVGEAILFTWVTFLTQIDLCVYSVIWVGFTLSMTKAGVNFCLAHFDESMRCCAITRRFVFLLGVHGLIGLVLGAFACWTLVDIVLGFPVPYLPIVVTVAVDLILCQCMLFCYDCGRAVDQDEDDE